ncbi:hypothetical protein NPIL_122511 [Nephila pilipes]|uniref:Uncharacterized protein n=1 Tax=Nephila pilipes TaxID=299642 RepID=A0A8X6P3R4_NEPPI|nr:hypothetical protein NPIL_122511 [Nephila pilipes]
MKKIKILLLFKPARENGSFIRINHRVEFPFYDNETYSRGKLFSGDIQAQMTPECKHSSPSLTFLFFTNGIQSAGKLFPGAILSSNDRQVKIFHFTWRNERGVWFRFARDPFYLKGPTDK